MFRRALRSGIRKWNLREGVHPWYIRSEYDMDLSAALGGAIARGRLNVPANALAKHFFMSLSLQVGLNSREG